MTADTNEQPSTDRDHQLPAQASESRRRKGMWIVIGTLLLLVIVLAVVLMWRHDEAAKKAKPAPPKITITTATARTGDIGVYLDEIGTVTPVYTDSITSEVTGLVEAVHFKEGQLVSKGDPLVDIDSRPYRANLLQAQGALERDENVLAQARMDLERYRDAWAKNSIAKQQLDDQEKIVLQDEGTVKNDHGTVQFDEVQVGFCHITAPISGRVGLRLVDPGNVVQSAGSVTLAVITQVEPITVIFTIPEDSLGPVQARLRAKATLTVDAFDRTALTKIASGKLLTLDNQIDTTTGTVKARAVFDNKNDALFPNQFVNTRLLVRITQMERRMGAPATLLGFFAGTLEAYQQSLGTEPLLILTALLAVYIVLGILYESLVHPLTIISTLPSASVGAMLALLLFKVDLNIISIIGIVLLIGIVKKNAIMMIDFALETERREGKKPIDAIFEACMLRFRPILMTTIAALLGALPLALGTGTGFELRRPLGITIVGGLILSQLLTLYTTPVVYLAFDRLRLRMQGKNSMTFFPKGLDRRPARQINSRGKGRLAET